MKTKVLRNSLGMYTLGIAEFVPLFPEKRPEFKPMLIKRFYYDEIKKTETTESICGTCHETESRITSQDKQTTTQAIE